MQHSNINGTEPAIQRDLATLRTEMLQLRKMACLADQRAAWPQTPAPAGIEERKDLEKRVREVLKWRRIREAYLGAELFADPAWDILLELYAAELSERRITVGDLCRGAIVPPTTGLRWLRTLETKGVIVRGKDPLDRRRVFMCLADGMSAKLTEFFRRVSGSVCI